MKPYLSIDLETTGLDPSYCQILEFAAILDDWETPVEQLPVYHKFLQHSPIVGEPFALSMHANLLRSMADPSFPTLDPMILVHDFLNWLTNKGVEGEVVVSGKNFAGFDLPFIRKLHGSERLKFHRRVLDPGMLYWQSDDEIPPSTQTCLDRAGIKSEVTHTANEDATDIIKLIRQARYLRLMEDEAKRLRPIPISHLSIPR